MIRSSAAGAVLVVLLAGASGASAAGIAPADRPTAAKVLTSTPVSTPVTAFALPVMTTPAQPNVRHHDAHRTPARHHQQHHHATRVAVSPPCPGTSPSPHFATPEAAMRYLARAWNARDLDALCHVTEPSGRAQLIEMHHEAVHLRFGHCDVMGVGLYSCSFGHHYPRHLHMHGHGGTFIEVAAARTPGWYMSGFMGCG